MMLQHKKKKSGMRMFLAVVLCVGQILLVQSVAASTFTQTDYRWYENVNAVQPTTPLAAENTSYSAVSTSSPFRLRMNITAGDTALATSTMSFKLQYGWNTAGPWVDVGDPWYHADWLYRKKITLNPLKVAIATSSFPLLVDLTDSGLASNAQADADDILFTDQEGNKLNHQIETYTSGTGQLTAWVRSAIASSTEIYMYYGNAATSSERAASSTVWDANFVGVWHLNENPTVGAEPTLKDSTGNALNGTEQGGMVTGDNIAGKIGKALNFAGGTNDYVVVNANSALNSANVTVSVWVKANTTSNLYFRYVIGKGANTCEVASYGFNTRDINATDIEFYISSDGATQTSTGMATVFNNAWRHLVGVFDDTNNVIRMYLDGVQMASVTTTNSIDHTGTTNNNLGFGQYLGTCDLIFTGQEDEIHISNVNRGAAWIATEYNNQSATSTFYTVGSQETYAVSGTSGVWRFANNASVSDNATTTATLLASSEKNESYEEASTTPKNLNAIPLNQEGEYDFALNPANATSTTYYLRMVTATSTEFTSYTNYPQVVVGASNPAYTQRNYRWFLNYNSVQPGSPKKGLNTAITNVDDGSLYRLRTDTSVATANLSTSGQAFILQYAALDGADCTGGGESWTAVGNATSSALWRSFVNTGATNGSAITSALLDTSNILGSYNDIISSTFTNPNAINIGQAGEWDWPIYNNSAAADTTYCFRVAKTGGTALDTYTNYPQLTTASIVSGHRGGGGSDFITPVETPTTGGTGTGGGTGSDVITPPETPSTGGSGQGGGGESSFVPFLQRQLAVLFEGLQSLLRLLRG